MHKQKIIVRSFCVLTILFLVGCATYYQKRIEFQEYFASGNLNFAQSFLDKNKKAAEKKDRLLYFMDRGVIEHMLGNYTESNQAFEQAYIFMEDYRKNFGSDALSLITNPMSQPYSGEDFEIVLIHYYKAINFIMLGDLGSALVEVKRINIKLNQLNDQYEHRKNRYSQDAFAQLLTGIIYEADKDYNNAFISYRNAYNTYKEVYEPHFGLHVPGQLKLDLLRSADLTGFTSELLYYEKELGINYQPTEKYKQTPYLVFFWLNGLGPIKGENSINFAMVKGQGGIVNFQNEEYGLNIPVPLPPSESSNAETGFGDLKFVRMALPKYNERQPIINTAKLISPDTIQELEMVENINKIAFSVLEDRMLRELGKSLLRLATKQAAEIAMRQENEELGALLSIANAVSEKADTRNWQTLPYSISYSRIPMEIGDNQVDFVYESSKGSDTVSFHIEAKRGETIFKTYHTLDSYLPM